MKKITMVLWCAMCMFASPAFSQKDAEKSDIPMMKPEAACKLCANTTSSVSIDGSVADCENGKQACESKLDSCVAYLGACYDMCPIPSMPSLPGVEDCDDGVDNDGDGKKDCADPACKKDSSCKKDKVADDKPVKHKGCDDRCQCGKKNGWWVPNGVGLPGDIEGSMDGRCLTLVQFHAWAWDTDTRIEDLAAALKGLEALMGKCCAAKVEESEIHYDYSYSAPASSCECSVSPADLDMLRKELSAFRARFQEIVNDLQAQLADKASKGELDALAAEVKALKARLDGLDKRLAKVEERLDDLEDRIADLEKRLAKVESDVEELKKAKAKNLGSGPGFHALGMVTFNGEVFAGAVVQWTILQIRGSNVTVNFKAHLGPMGGLTEDENFGMLAGGRVEIFPGTKGIFGFFLGYDHLATGYEELWFRNHPDPKRKDDIALIGIDVGKSWPFGKDPNKPAKVSGYVRFGGTLGIGLDHYEYNINADESEPTTPQGVRGWTGIVQASVGVEIILFF
ncbi:MAG: hypothetical protein PHW53_00370 [Patescibacteria group bacterium]|nr:hypothetical protein [Patescibacteria group bacterium]